MPRILVVRGGAIGDFVVSLPVFRALKAQFPQARVELLGYPKMGSLACSTGLVDAVHNIEAAELAPFFSRQGVSEGKMADLFRSSTIVISYLYDPDRVFQENVARVSQARFIQGMHRPDENGGEPASKVFLKCLQSLAIYDADPVPVLPISARRNPFLLAVHPGSGGERKNWPEKSWVELLQQINAVGHFEFLVVGGEAEGDRVARLAQTLAPRPVEVVFNQPLADLARRLATASFFFGHDSGISHIAAALGIPSLLIWGPSDAAVWKPPHDQVGIVKSDSGILAVSPREVFSRFNEAWNDLHPSGEKGGSLTTGI